MKIFDLDNIENLKNEAVLTEVDEKGNPVDHSLQAKISR